MRGNPQWGARSKPWACAQIVQAFDLLPSRARVAPTALAALPPWLTQGVAQCRTTRSPSGAGLGPGGQGCPELMAAKPLRHTAARIPVAQSGALSKAQQVPDG